MPDTLGILDSQTSQECVMQGLEICYASIWFANCVCSRQIGLVQEKAGQDTSKFLRETTKVLS